MHLTKSEQRLISDDRLAVFAFADSEECIAVDHRAEEEQIFADVTAMLPDGFFLYDFDGEQSFSATCGDNRRAFDLEFSSEDRYRALRFINDLIKPGYEIKIMRCRFDDDQHSFLLRPAEWWSEFGKIYPAKMSELFLEIDDTTNFH